MTKSFNIAVVGPPFGVKGFVKVRSLSGETAHLRALKSVRLKQGEEERVFSVEETTLSGDILLMKFHGINSPEAASALKGARLFVDRSQAAPLNEGEFYVEDLKGLQVIATSPESSLEAGEVLGHITDILEGGGGELAEIRLLSGEIKLVPFRKEFIGDISMEKGLVILLERWILE